VVEGPLASDPSRSLLSGRIPSLDGLRAVAILLVIQSHLAGGAYWLPGQQPGHLSASYADGELGVRIFFAISGFLITSLLLREQQTHGCISLRQFYLRRACRILPANYVLLTCLALATLTGILAIPTKAFLASFLYLRNYGGGSNWYTAHLWSLSVEEQFYLLWPALLAFVPRRVAITAAICTIPVANLLRLFGLGGEFSHLLNPSSFLLNMDALACGALLACFWSELGGCVGYQRFLRSPFFWIAPATVIAQAVLPIQLSPTSDTLYLAVSSPLIAVCIERFVRYPLTPCGKVLNSRAAVGIGILSYSLYLWQQPFVVEGGGSGLLQSFPLNLAITAVCALVSYRLVERPFLRLRDKHKMIQS
jgi:peptidoglycan/LPS O-acetylase OafA/YrhL